MRKYLSLLLVLLIVIASPLSVLASKEPILLPSGLTQSDIESVIDTYVEENEDTTAAVSVSVFTGDDVLFEKAYGYVDGENEIMNDSEAVFEWGSCTKLLTWSSVMQLVEKGKIDLNEDIRTYLPEGFFTKLKYDTPITMMNLMNHNAGWQEVVTDLFIEDQEDIKALGYALSYVEPEQVNEPGTVVAYSNWGSALAGYIVECVSGISFDDYIHEFVFEPLGMKHTAIAADLSDNTWVMEKRAEQKCYTSEGESLGTSQYYISLYPAGMATGTISDFVKFAQAFAPAEGENAALFEKAETLSEMLSPSLYYADGRTARNCHGFWTDELGVPVLWHNGGTLGSTSWFAFNVESGTGVVIFTNQSSEWVYTCGILPMVFGEMKQVANTDYERDLSGMYVSARTCFKGFAKPYIMACYMQLVTSEGGGYKVPGVNYTFTDIGASSYVMDVGGVKQYIVQVDTIKNGTKVLQLPGTDYTQVNGYGVIAQYILLLLFVIAVLINLVALPVNLIGVIRRRKNRPLIGYRIAVNSAVLISVSMFVYIAITLFGNGAIFRMIQWGLILNAACALVPIVYIIAVLMKWRKIEATKKQKVGLILCGIGGLIMTINVFYWNTFMFW